MSAALKVKQNENKQSDNNIPIFKQITYDLWACVVILTGIQQAHLVAATTADDFLSLMLDEVRTCYCLCKRQLPTTGGLPGSAEGWTFLLY